MDFQIAGLPLHILLVHVVVVGVPLLAIVLVVLAAWTPARRALWLVALLAALLLLGLTYLTIESGEWLEERVAETPLIEQHTGQGEDILPWMIALTVVSALIAALAIIERRERRGRTDPEVATNRGMTPPATRRRPWRVAVAVLLIVAAVGVAAGSIWTMVQIGDSGARAVWEGSFSDQPEGD
jgi:phosphoglycerol transferase MdoB-like AlkP superfamily enzyme